MPVQLEQRVVTPRMVSELCRKRVTSLLPPCDTERLQRYMLQLIRSGKRPPRIGRGTDWGTVAAESGIEEGALRAAESTIRYMFDAMHRSTAECSRKSGKSASAPKTTQAAKPEQHRLATTVQSNQGRSADCPASRKPHAKGKPRGKHRAIEACPAAKSDNWVDPDCFHHALALHMERFGDSCSRLCRAIVGPGELTDRRTLLSWRRGEKCPATVESLATLARIEVRYGLPAGYFKAKLPHPARAAKRQRLMDIGAAEQRRLAWHLPDDFDRRPAAEREEILTWVRSVMVSGATDYRRFQAAAMKYRYALRFPEPGETQEPSSDPAIAADETEERLETGIASDPELRPGRKAATAALAREVAAFVRFKTSKLTAVGYRRLGTWCPDTANQKVEHLALMFGAMAASPTSPVRGHGVPVGSLTLGMFVFPAVWDWYIQWRERRRGFYTSWEADMLRLGLALTREETGFLRQTPSLAARLCEVPGLVTADDVGRAKGDWSAACEGFRKYALGRVKEVEQLARVHRDPFEPILPVLEAASPLSEYRKITEEILRLMPDERRYPKPAAEAVRAFLMLRFGLHLGVRQKNLRQLLFCPRGSQPTSERRLEDMKRGELRWRDRGGGWEVFIPVTAFKNAHSSFFSKQPFRLLLPDLCQLYANIDAYMTRHRGVLLGDAADPCTFFVKTVKTSSGDPAYDMNTFYEAWRLTVQRYGIYNPYTGRGAIKGLLPHGPHNVRDVLATHILKQTGSYEQASYAIQDTPETVARHYGRFLPQDKAEMAARILNRVWEID